MLLELKKVARLNISKCKSMQITRKHHPIEFTYKLQCANGEAVIERTEQERDHGVWTTSNLSWSKQVSEQCVRGNKMLCCIKRSTRNINSLHSRKRGNTSQESKYILDLPFITNTTYSQRLSQLQLLTLTYWHEYLDLIFFFKCVNGIIDVNNETSPKPPQSNKTWNTLPKPIRSNTNSLSSFKSLLFKYHTTALKNNYNVDDSLTWKTVCL